MIGKLRAVLSPLFQDKPTPPEPFGFKMGWIAVRSTDLKAVAESLPLREQRPANWHDGIDAAYKSGPPNSSVFIAPPVNGWICVVGWWAAGTGDQNSVEAVAKVVSDLSFRFGEAQGFATHRVVEYHHWILAKQGRVQRCFAYLGERGEILCKSGQITDAERKLKFAGLPPDQWMPGEQDVMTIAGGWSFDPSQLSPVSAVSANGILAKVAAR